jgi:peptidoglycan/xylan/chitin deacetylase (PgdA/CDA1 family)
MPADVTGARFRNGMLITGSTPHRLILFTFDDGPDRRTTPRLLDYLDDAGVKAVFFVTARRVRGESAAQREQAEILRDLARRGHLVGNHTVDHLALPRLSNEEALAQIKGNEAILERVLGARPWLFRPPYGQRTPRVDELLRQRGYTVVLWNLGAGDWQCSSAEEVFATWKRVFDRREAAQGDRGGIVLLHDTHPWSVDAFPLIFAELMRRNCALLERGEELYDIVDDPAFFFTPRGAALASTHGPGAVLAPEVLEARQARLRERTRERCEAERAARPQDR